MKWKTMLELSLLCFLISVTCLNAQAELSALKGMWLNPHQDTGGITKMEITEEDGKWQIQAWGKCSPKDCDWGKVDLHFLVSSPGMEYYTHAFAKWEPGFKTQYIMIQIEKEELLVQTIAIYKDQSGRSGYIGRYLLQRKR